MAGRRCSAGASNTWALPKAICCFTSIWSSTVRGPRLPRPMAPVMVSSPGPPVRRRAGVDSGADSEAASAGVAHAAAATVVRKWRFFMR